MACSVSKLIDDARVMLLMAATHRNLSARQAASECTPMISYSSITQGTRRWITHFSLTSTPAQTDESALSLAPPLGSNFTLVIEGKKHVDELPLPHRDDRRWTKNSTRLSPGAIPEERADLPRAAPQHLPICMVRRRAPNGLRYIGSW